MFRHGMQVKTVHFSCRASAIRRQTLVISSHIIATLCAGLLWVGSSAQEFSTTELAAKRDTQKRLYEAAARDLPHGVPNPLNPDGTHSDAFMFTTGAYQREALRILLR